MLVMERAALPLLVSVTGCDALEVPTVWLEKVRVVGAKVTAGLLEPAPVPVRAALCGLPLALSVMFSEPGRVPLVVGVKVTLMVQLALGASVEPLLKAPPDQLSNIVSE